MQSYQRILHVDDDPSFTRVVEARLGRMGIDVVSTNDPLNVEDLIRQHEASIILLDLDMPTRDGLDVLKAIRRMNGDRRVILLTGRVTITTVINAMNMGADYLFFKPDFSYVDLAEAIHMLDFRFRHWHKAAHVASRLQRGERTTKPKELCYSSGGQDDFSPFFLQGEPSRNHEQIAKLLLDKRAVTKSMIKRANAYCERLTPSFLMIALECRLLTQQQVFTILAEQTKSKSTEELVARRLGFLLVDDVQAILRRQQLRRPDLVSALIALGSDEEKILDILTASDSDEIASTTVALHSGV